MTIDFDRAAKPLRKLRRLLKNFAADPCPEDVHRLRTQTRKLEATLTALFPSNDESQKLRKLMKPVRRSAGAVRDMDVLIAKASSLAPHAEPDGMVRLLEHLAKQRALHARHLHAQVQKRQSDARDSLKRCLRQIEKLEEDGSKGHALTPAPAQILSAKLDHWPRLQRDNLHDFRKTLKRLRYTAQLSTEPDEQLLRASARANDSIGDWHDWEELSTVAEQALAPEAYSTLFRSIHSTLQDKSRTAIAEANRLRKRRSQAPRAA